MAFAFLFPSLRTMQIDLFPKAHLVFLYVDFAIAK